VLHKLLTAARTCNCYRRSGRTYLPTHKPPPDTSVVHIFNKWRSWLLLPHIS